MISYEIIRNIKITNTHYQAYTYMNKYLVRTHKDLFSVDVRKFHKIKRLMLPIEIFFCIVSQGNNLFIQLKYTRFGFSINTLKSKETFQQNS